MRRVLNLLVAPAVALVTAVVVASLALVVSGNSPIDAFRAMFTFVDSTASIVTIVNRAVPLYVASLAVAIGFKMNLFNIGADGQYRLAALLAAAAGAAVSLPAILHVPFIMVVAIATGGAWAAIPGFLKVTRGVNEVVSTIMLNYVATGVSAYLLLTYFRNERVVNIAETKVLPPSGRLPTLDSWLRAVGFHLPPGSRLQGFLPIAIAIGIAFYVVVWRTRFGYDLRMSGANAAAARASGVASNGMVVKTIVLSGMLAGLAAMAPLLCENFKYNEGFPLGTAFTGIGVALLGRNHPAGIAVAAFVWAGVEHGARNLSSVDIPSETSKILLGTLLLSAVVSFELVRRRNLAATVHAASHAPPLTATAGAT